MTELLQGEDGLARAAALLLEGELVAFGTETVYGLGADATRPTAVARIFEAKGRPHFNPLICHYPDADAAFRDVLPDDTARRLVERFWPGPLTLVLPRRVTCQVALLAGAGLDTLAVRVPASAMALDLLRAVARPVAAPSANRSGQVSPTSAAHVLQGLAGRIAAVLESGPMPGGRREHGARSFGRAAIPVAARWRGRGGDRRGDWKVGRGSRRERQSGRERCGRQACWCRITPLTCRCG